MGCSASAPAGGVAPPTPKVAKYGTPPPSTAIDKKETLAAPGGDSDCAVTRQNLKRGEWAGAPARAAAPAGLAGHSHPPDALVPHGDLDELNTQESEAALSPVEVSKRSIFEGVVGMVRPDFDRHAHLRLSLFLSTAHPNLIWSCGGILAAGAGDRFNVLAVGPDPRFFFLPSPEPPAPALQCSRIDLYLIKAGAFSPRCC